MAETYAQIDAVCDATYAQLLEVQSLKASLLAQKAALIAYNTADPANISQSGEAGSESYGMQTLTDQIAAMTRVEAELTEVYRNQLELKQSMFPFQIPQRMRVGGDVFSRGCGYAWGGWW